MLRNEPKHRGGYIFGIIRNLCMELDRSTIKLLASDTRSDIVKALGVRRKTLTELSRELGLAPATVTEQLAALERGGLVHKMDEGRKWKYYELTRKSREMTKPQMPLVLILSTLAVLLFGAVFLSGYSLMGAAKAPAPSGGQAPATGINGFALGVGTSAAAASPTVSASCSDGTVRIDNPTADEVDVFLTSTGGGTLERKLAAGAELEEQNVSNGTVFTEAGTISYDCR